MRLALSSQGKCQQECGEALSHISCCPEGREGLVRANASKATAVLVEDRTEHIMYSCAVILSNMSSLPRDHQQMISDGLMSTLAILADAKFPHTQRLVGRIFHNVSCAETHR